MDNTQKNNNVYFAAANTPNGFVSMFDDIFGSKDIKRLFILKGGPGVGKSTFLKNLGRLAENMGETCEYFLCSSDTTSLDGIIIKSKNCAVIDGTSPHAVEPKLAGAREIIIDLGRAWDINRLYKSIDEIQKISTQKLDCYDECYRLLYCKSAIDELNFNLILPHILSNKLDKSTERLCRSLFRKAQKKQSKINVRLTEAFSAQGNIHLCSFENLSNCVIFLKEPRHDSRVPSMFMHRIYDYAKNLGADMYVSYSPMSKSSINGLYFPEISTCIVGYDQDSLLKCDKLGKKARIINTCRFVDEKQLSRVKPLLKFYAKLSLGLKERALDMLKCAGKKHAHLEKIYSSCTDYSTVESISKQYFDVILNPKP